MSPARVARWKVHLPAAGTDPYLAATLFLLEREHGALIVSPASTGAGPDPARHGSVHARALFEAVPIIDPLCPGPLARCAGLGLVLVEPTPDVLEALDPQVFPTGPGVMLVSSSPDSERHVWQMAWLWAQQHDPPDLWRHTGDLDPRVVDPVGVLTNHEVWALAVRAGARNAVSLRPSRQAESAGRAARISRLVRWRA